MSEEDREWSAACAGFARVLNSLGGDTSGWTVEQHGTAVSLSHRGFVQGTGEDVTVMLVEILMDSNVYKVPLLGLNVEDAKGQRLGAEAIKALLNQTHPLVGVVFEREHPIKTFETFFIVQGCDTLDFLALLGEQTATRWRPTTRGLVVWWSLLAGLLQVPWSSATHALALSKAREV